MNEWHGSKVNVHNHILAKATKSWEEDVISSTPTPWQTNIATPPTLTTPSTQENKKEKKSREDWNFAWTYCW